MDNSRPIDPREPLEQQTPYPEQPSWQGGYTGQPQASYPEHPQPPYQGGYPGNQQQAPYPGGQPQAPYQGGYPGNQQQAPYPGGQQQVPYPNQQQSWQGGYPGQQQAPYPGQSQQSWQGGYPGQQQAPYHNQMMPMEQQKNWLVTILLCHFLGYFGIHRFYTGRIVSGIFQLLTFGGFGIWVLVDLIMIVTDNFNDSYERPLYHPPIRGGNKSWATTALLCMFLGSMGIHRFYTGRIVSGIFQFLTFGGFGIWTLIDLIMIHTDSFTDGTNAPLTRL